MSKSSSLPAQRQDAFEAMANDAAGAAPAWKQEVNERLAAHRTRRGGAPETAGNRAPESPRAASARAAEAAARVAARYAKAPSYSELLAGEARAVVRAAGAAAEAARNAQAAAEAVLAGLESGPIASGLWQPAGPDLAVPWSAPSPAAAPARWQDEPPAAAPAASSPDPWAGAQPRWEEALPVAPAEASRDVWSEMRVHPGPETEDRYAASALQGSGAMDRVEEGELFPGDSFRAPEEFDGYDPLRTATVEPVKHLPANLIEFPRELLATRKARPRLSDGPFYEGSHAHSQLSIFEVDPELAAPATAASGEPGNPIAPPEWASIQLDHLDHRSEPQASAVAETRSAYAEPVYSAAVQAQANSAAASGLAGSALVELPEMPAQTMAAPQTRTAMRTQARAEARIAPAVAPAQAAELLVARLSDRLLAAVVDGALVTLAGAAAGVVVLASTAHPPTGQIALIASAVGLLVFALLYQFLFLSYAEEGTPGMRYARIALCTFDDDNPTRRQMRMRIPAMLLAALPAGLGLLWAVFDRDHLAWHDRWTRTYQRKY